MATRSTGSDWNYAPPVGGILNTTTAVTVKAAVGTLKNKITALSLMSEVLTTATEFCIRDGAAGTVLFRVKIPTTGITFGTPIIFDPPLAGSAGNLIEIVTLTATTAGAVYANLQGYTEG